MIENKTPRHVTIIMDGNGRWARERGMERLFGHNTGTNNVRVCCEYAVEMGIEYLSLFAFSQENWSRPDGEILGLMKIMVKSIISEKTTFEKNNIRFLVIGDRTSLPQELLNEVDLAMSETENNTGLSLILFLSYSGKWDILQATHRYAEYCVSSCGSGEALPLLDGESYEKYLATYGIPDPDLLIRTSGEQRMSNFLLWQCAYTELYFTDVLWPDFSRGDFQAALESFTSRERRYGKTGAQIIK